ncbi:MAG: Lacal_2735 family protein [Flavobacteriales bacterium]|tara:strand:- start:3448 stop:3612 length:165 start_codon:yes stop_codon:yes gene_type:complete
MFNLFKRKTEKEKLEEQYEKCLKESYRLSTINRSESDLKIAEANKILEQIEKLK